MSTSSLRRVGPSTDDRKGGAARALPRRPRSCDNQAIRGTTHCWLTILCAFAWGCGDRSPAAPASTEGPAASSSGSASSGAAPEPTPVATYAACEAIGRAEIPEAPTSAARRANRDALRAHGRGDFDAALAGFERALALSPGYDNARFNAACALARLGRVDEARDLVRTLLCTDLPSYAPRALQDPDLEALRATPELAAFVAAVGARYEAAMDAGVPLLAYREERIDEPGYGAYGGPTTTQAGVWLHAERRFVPLSPSLRVDQGDAPIVAPLLDVARREVVVVTTPGSGAEGDVGVPTRLRLFRTPTGEPLADARLGGEPVVTEVGFSPDGVAVRVFDADGPVDAPPTTYRFDASGLTRAPAVPMPTFVRVGPLAWWLRMQTPMPSLPRSPTPVLGGGRGTLRNAQHRWAWVDEARRLGVVLAADWGDCGAPDRYTLDVVDLAAGVSVRHEGARGQVHVMLGRDGALYVQRGAELLRFADPRVDASEPLPAGLGLTSRPVDHNPYC